MTTQRNGSGSGGAGRENEGGSGIRSAHSQQPASTTAPERLATPDRLPKGARPSAEAVVLFWSPRSGEQMLKRVRTIGAPAPFTFDKQPPAGQA